MAKNNFIMLELDNDKTKEIANAVSNKSCRKILDRLAEKERTESELAKELDLPISTVHYNLQQLIKTNLVSADEYHYSEKGKEVLHYRIANKYIIITPKKVSGIAQKLKNILPAALICAGFAGLIEIFMRFSIGKEKALAGAGEQFGIRTESAPMLAMDMQDSAVMLASESIDAAQGFGFFQSPALWFLAGALISLGIYALIIYLRRDK